MSREILKLKNIQKTFHDGEQETQVLNDITFSVMSGDYVAISGPSGCGKSTLLNIMGLLDTPDNGEYYIDGELALNMSIEQRATLRSSRIGFVFQSFNLIDEYSVLENIALPLKYRGDSYSKRIAIAKSCLERVGLENAARKYPSQLSGGQQQRVSIARALASDSGIMLVDEPTGNLDSSNGNIVMDLLDELNSQGTTICLVTHDQKFANRAQREIKLFDGRIESTV